MARFIFSAFSDEITPDFRGQLESLKKLGISMCELRGVNGKSFVDLTDDEVKEVKSMLDNYGIGLSALGSPIGKVKADADMNAHCAKLERIMDIGDALCCKVIRMFSFYRPDAANAETFKKLVFDNIGTMLDRSEKRGFILCHENEKDIFGEKAIDEKELLDAFGGRLKAVFDPGNFAFCGEDAIEAYGILKDRIRYLHIKDADAPGSIVPPGKGKAGLAEILKRLDKDRPEGTVILTMEPHLTDFTGLASLANAGAITHKYRFDTPYEAFEYAFFEVLKMVKD